LSNCCSVCADGSRAFPYWSVWFQPVAGGLTVGLLGYFLPDVMGVGYSYVGKILNGDVVLKTVVLLAVLKIVATSVAYASGNAGGIFGPSLFIGATMGAAVGSVAHRLFPAYTAGPGAYALVGMGTAFAGIVRTPLTSVIMIFEVTRDYTIIVPLMISNLIAYLISYGFQRTPIYEALAYQDGVHLPSAKARDQAGKMKVGQAMRSLAAALEEDTEASGEFKRLTDLVAESATTPPHVHPDHQLSLALERMGASGLNVLPVISRADVRKLVGIVVLDDVLRAFGVTKPSEARESAGLN
jgi:CIC family chloride channel protein